MKMSKTRMTELVKNFHAEKVSAGFSENPALIKLRDERGVTGCTFAPVSTSHKSTS
jgi:hypothetical protein